MSYKKSLTDFYHIVIESSWVSIDNLKYNLEVLAWFSFFKMFSNIKSTNNTSTVLEFHLPFITTYGLCLYCARHLRFSSSSSPVANSFPCRAQPIPSSLWSVPSSFTPQNYLSESPGPDQVPAQSRSSANAREMRD